MSVVTLVIDSVLLLGIIGVSLRGAAILPAGAQLPMHFGPARVRWPASSARPST